MPTIQPQPLDAGGAICSVSAIPDATIPTVPATTFQRAPCTTVKMKSSKVLLPEKKRSARGWRTNTLKAIAPIHTPPPSTWTPTISAATKISAMWAAA